MLCFDGDNAGRRAAYRAVDLALPLLKPGKSLKFALLPRGAGPRRSRALRRPRGDRRGARRARARSPTCCGCARPRAAASIRRSGARRSRRASTRSTRGIGDEAVRQILPAGFRRAPAQLFAPPRSSAERAAANWREPRGGGNWRERRNDDWPRRERPRTGRQGGGPTWWRAGELASSPVHRGHRTALPRREALILLAVLNHPWLLHDHLEEFAALEFRHADAERLQGGADRHRRPSAAARSMPAALQGRARRRATSPRCWPAIAGRHHHPVGLGRAPGGRARRCFGDLAAACHLASAMALPN